MKETPAGQLNPLKSEHLSEGVRPIIACVGTYDQYGKETAEIQKISHIGHNVDLFSSPEKLINQDLKNDGEMTYVISAVDDRPKFTEQLFSCSSLVAAGISLDSNTNLSLLTHQDPYSLLINNKDAYVRDLKERLSELKNKCREGTVDLVIVGGQVGIKYAETMEMLGTIVQEVFDFSPVIITGPKDGDQDDIFYDNDNFL